MADRTTRFNNCFQIISNVAIIVGLGLVVYELNQSKQLAHAQFTQQEIDRLANILVATMGEDPRESFAKAEFHPADLNERDAVALDAYYQSIVNGWVRIADIDTPWQGAVEEALKRNFGSEPGRRWLRAWVATIEDKFGMAELAEIVRETVDDAAASRILRSRYELLLAND
jgi:hypothetical protein